jgi:peptidoglycan/LPS O-acetylase OafA/YrhL
MDYRFLVAPAILGSMMLCCFLLSRINALPHLSDEHGRYGFIDGLRGIAAALVVCAHSWRIQFTGYKNDHFLGADYYWHSALGAIGVQVFFCITGFLFFEKLLRNPQQNWTLFYIARIKRLAPLYLFTCLAIIITAMSFSDLSKWGVDSIGQILRLISFSMMGTNFVVGGQSFNDLTVAFWSLVYEWRFYFFIPFAAAMMVNDTCRKYFYTITTVLVIAFLCTEKSNISAYFFIGAVVAFVKNRYLTLERYRTFFLFAFIASAGVNIMSVTCKWPLYGVERFLISSPMFLFAVLSQPKALSFKHLRFMGEISYSVYINHILIYFLYGYLVRTYLNIGQVSTTGYFLVLGGFCFVTCVVSLMTFKYIEYPFIKK